MLSSLFNSCFLTQYWFSNVTNLRNVGIIAHIDAGKTTTTERMLFYSKMLTHSMGNVDDGDTTTDFLKMERERGITIESACAYLDWKDTRIQLIDTPGHVDFTVEVERALRVMDGAVVITDAVEGIEAQSETVWKQADQYQVPRCVFINKMDRRGASISATLKSLQSRLNVENPLLLHLPVNYGNGTLDGIVDLVNLDLCLWDDDRNSNSDSNSFSFENLDKGETFNRIPWTDWNDVPKHTHKIKSAFGNSDSYSNYYLEWAQISRKALLEQLCNLDDEFFEEFLSIDDYSSDSMLEHFSSVRLKQLIRNLCIDSKVNPILVGSSLKNRGIQLVMDSIVDYLPSPSERPPIPLSILSTQKVHRQAEKNDWDQRLIESSPIQMYSGPVEQGPPNAYVFKVTHPSPNQPLSYVRCFTGKISTSDLFWNSNQGISERPRQLLRIFGNRVEKIDSLQVGEIGAFTGLKHTRSGDTLLPMNSLMNIQQLNKSKNYSFENLPLKFPTPPYCLHGMSAYAPVFWVACETETNSQKAQLDEILDILSLEDPSISISVDPLSGHTLLGGQGELHIEILTHKIKHDFNFDIDISKPQIAYKETIENSVDVHGESSLASQEFTISTHLQFVPFARNTRLSWSSNEWEHIVDSPSTQSSSPNQLFVNGLIAKSEFSIDTPTIQESNDYQLIAVDRTNGFVFFSPRNSELPPSLVSSIQGASFDSLHRGALIGYPNDGIAVFLLDVQQNGTPMTTHNPTDSKTNTLIRSAVNNTVSEALKKATPTLLEPMMDVIIDLTDATKHLGSIMSDLSSNRRATISSVNENIQEFVSNSPSIQTISSFEQQGGHRVLHNQSRPASIHCFMPSASLLGYSTILRSQTQGKMSFRMQFSHYDPVQHPEQQRILNSMRGY